MNKYERMVTYIYEYNAGQKENNVGYAKIERRGEKLRIYLQIKGVTQNNPELYIYKQLENDIEKIKVSGIDNINGQISFKIEDAESKILGEEKKFEDMDGIIIFDAENHFFASSWKLDNITIGKKENIIEVKKEENSEENEEENKEEEVKEEQAQIESQSVCETCPFKHKEMDYGKKILSCFPTMSPFISDKKIPCVKIELQDIGCLPMKYWCLTGNHFLLHGYYCYRHLIFIQWEDGRYMLGVPGVYSEKAEKNALHYGFNKFVSIGDFEKRPGAFGYWLYGLI